jgi:glycosyltransferase involved in cell wall biosynthesis
MISIIIPTLNEEDYLPLLLESIKNQDFDGEYEIIVADAGSVDKTREIAKSFGCRVVKGGLPAKGRNEGAKIAKDDILLFIDADVILPKNFLQKTIEEVSRRNLDVAGFLISPQNPKQHIYKFAYNLYNFWGRNLEKFSPQATMIILAKKDLHQRIKGFDEDIKIGEDHWYVRQASKYGKFGIIKSTKVFASMRRFEKDGLIKTCLKYIFTGIYMFLFGPIKREIFKYEFNHYKNFRS